MTTRINKNQIKIPGGSTGQALIKLSNTDYDYDWGSILGVGGGTKLAIDTTQEIVGLNTTTDIYTINIPSGTLGSNNGIRFTIPVSSLTLEDNGGQVEIFLKYGSTTIASIILINGENAGNWSSQGYINGMILADNSTSAQKGMIQAITGKGEVIENGNPSNGSTSIQDTGSATENSTTDLNLTITVQTSNSPSASITTEAIVVEKISTLGTTLQPTEQFLGGLNLVDGQVKASTCSEDGSVVFVLFRDTGSSGLRLVRYEKDTNTGMYKVTHQDGFGVSDGNGASIVIVGIYVYVLYEGTGGSAGTMQGQRLLASDLSGVTALTTGSPAYSVYGSAFSDGTDIYVNLSGTTWTQFTITGTVITSGSTITGGMANASGSLYVGGNVYMTDASGAVQVFSYGGGVFTLLDGASYACLGLINSSSSYGVNIIPIVDNIGYVAYRYSFTADTGGGIEVQESVILKSFTLPTP